MRITQVCARIEFGDAVSNHVIEIDRYLSSLGHETSIFANTLDEFGKSVASDDGNLQPITDSNHVLIYHYSIYCENFKKYLESKCKKVLVYHNITPPQFFEPYDAGVASFLKKGRELIPSLRECDLALGDSEFNRRELVEMGFREENTGVLPVFVDYESLTLEKPVSQILREYRDSFNILFVGRRVPNKRLEDVIRAFFYYKKCVNENSRLILVGPQWVEKYDAQLRWLVDSFGLWSDVLMTGKVSRRELASYYRIASVYLSMSEHEGFAVPCVECMAFGIPIVAYLSTAIPFTLGGSGIMFTEKDFPKVGELMEIIRTDDKLREKIVTNERSRLSSFSRKALENAIDSALLRV
ncbi:MAG: glycosyltransferase [Actinomycetota bacterium]|nr:glycosyltransferase [Actinomycetota bacterium]